MFDGRGKDCCTTTTASVLLLYAFIETMETEESPVDYILKTAGLDDDAIAVLKQAGLTSVDRMCRHCDIEFEKRVRESKVMPFDIADVLQVRRWIQAYKEEHGGYPTNWRESFTSEMFQTFCNRSSGNVGPNCFFPSSNNLLGEDTRTF